jgi:hypothetical protein
MPAIHARVAVTAVALAALVSLSACAAGTAPAAGGSGGSGGGTGDGGSKPAATATAAAKGLDVASIDPCKLFTKAAAEQLVGSSLADAEDFRDPTQPSCTYNPDPNAGMTAKAALNVGGGAESFYNVDKNNAQHEFTDVPGLGDEGHLERQAIFWKSHGTWFGISMLRLVDDDHQFDQPLIDAAKAVQAQVG